jgi:hypothetical protein
VYLGPESGEASDALRLFDLEKKVTSKTAIVGWAAAISFGHVIGLGL